MFKPLEEYFKHSENFPPVLQKLFKESSSIFWLHFIENQLDLSNQTILSMETAEGSCFEIAIQMKLLRDKFANRRKYNFTPRFAKQEKEKLSDDTKKEIDRYVERFV